MKSQSAFARHLATLGVLFILVISGCATKMPVPESVLDTPELHVSNGYKLIRMGFYQDAVREFEKALQYSPAHCLAFVGMGLANGYLGDTRAAFQSMEKAQSQAKSREEKLRVHVGWIRLHTLKRGKGWLEDAQREYLSACAIAQDYPASHYYMGLAYKEAFRLEDGKKAFAKVLHLNGALVEEAREEIRVIERIEVSKPVSSFGRTVALQERITRAETAALFVHEFDLERLLGREKGAEQDGGTGRGIQQFPADIANHALKSEIEKIISFHVKGLAVPGGGTFGPDEVVTRAGFAVMAADVLTRTIRDPAFMTNYRGEPSPFKDVKNDSPYFSAIMVCRAVGAFEAESEIFNPMGAISGCDALFVIRKIKNRLNSHK